MAANKDNTTYQVRRIYSVLNPKSKYLLLQLLAIIIVSGLLDLVSLAVFGPFLSILTSIQALDNNSQNNNLQYLGFDHQINLSPALLTIVFCLVVVISSLFKLVTLKKSAQITEYIGSLLSYEAFKRILALDYLLWKNLNSSHYVSTLTTKLFYTVTAIYTSLRGISALFNSFFITAGMIILAPYLTIAAAFTIGFAYFISSRVLKRGLVENSNQIDRLFGKQVKYIQESFRNLKSIKLSSSYLEYELHIYDDLVSDLRRRQSSNQFKSSSPKVLIESTGLIFLAVSSYLIVTTSGSSKLLSTIGIFALGLQKLLPNFQSIFGAWTSLKSRSHEISTFIAVFDFPKACLTDPKINDQTFLFERLNLENICYSYPTSSEPVISNFSLSIEAGSKIAVVGPSGSGKSTLLDLIMGLLRPDSGSIHLQYSTEYLSSQETTDITLLHPWLGHVSQRVQLKDDTILNNIIMDLPYDSQKLTSVLRSSHAYEFVSALPQKENTVIGEDGALLSGGQLQRLSLAQSLYREPQILVYDEATSALDKSTEKRVITSLCELPVTIILVTHSPEMITFCDKLVNTSSVNSTNA